MPLREQFVNNYSSTLNGAINNSTTSVVVTSATGLPTGGGYRILVESEIMYVSARSGTTLTVVRGAEGTTAASHADGITVVVILTAEALKIFRYMALADAGVCPMEVGDNADDDRFDDENFSGWTTVQGTPNVTVTEQNHKCSILLPSGSASAQLYAFMKAKTPSAGGFVQAGFQMMPTGGQFPICGVIMANGATYNSGNQVRFDWSPYEQVFILATMTGYNTYGGSANTYGNIGHNQPMAAMHLRFQWNSSNNYTISASADGITWASPFSGSFGSMGSPTHFGFHCTSWGATRPSMFAFNYCRFNF